MEVRTLQNAPVNTLIKLDPRTKLFIVVIISSFMMSGKISGNAVYPRMVLAAVPFVLLLAGRRARAAFLYAGFLTAGELAEAFLVYTTSGILNITVVMLSGVITRFFPCVTMGYYLMATTRVSEFIAAMERLRVPMSITIPLSVMFRFFPTVGEESRSINDAMKMRGIGLRSAGSNPAALLEYRFVPLMMSVVRIGDELSASVLTRGLGGPVKRTNVCAIGFGLWDAVFAGITIGAAVLYKTI